MTASVAAELGAAAETIGSYQRRVGALAGSFGDGEREDLVAAIYEAERALSIAERSIRRALRIAAR